MGTSDAEQTYDVLLIHGTAAQHPDDAGELWWQQSSEFGADLQSKLGSTVRVQPCVPEQASVFHWSGANSERDRRLAGRRLFQALAGREREPACPPYSLVGHSHGGSVIHHALLTAVRKGVPLTKLRSWMTIATPFLEFRAAGAAWLWCLPAALSVVLVHSLFTTSPNGVDKLLTLSEEGI